MSWWCGVQHDDAFLACSYCCNCSQAILLLWNSFVNCSSLSLLYFRWLCCHLICDLCCDFRNFFGGSFCIWKDTRVFDFELGFILYLRLFQHVKVTFDSSASVNTMMTIKIFITITTVTTTKFISRSHIRCLDVYYINIHKVRIVFVPFAADDVVIIFVFCRSKFLI